ncbi:hypothetical protein AA0121_g11547 [Alternaria tenuissima]|nr:hypothetical protein AA0115_g8968 [Alternaria tenuissima]RYO07770.1 hypothetical protein AA0121_g11547 [Alternaria tenuissima]RYO45826.1 hypothetical protein AA0116_g12954 [Alternaria tenuissima]
MGVKPKHYLTHLTKWHTDHPEVNTSKKARMLLVEELLLKGPIDPDLPEFQLPQLGLLALPHLPIHEGLSCQACNYTCLAKQNMDKHYQRQHAEHKRAPGRPSKADALTVSNRKRVSCQRLFVQGCKSHYFAVISPAEIEEEKDTIRRRDMAAQLLEAEYIRAQIDEALKQGHQETQAFGDRILDNAAPTEVSPWLEMTRWPKYLQGHSFIEIARLASPASLASEPLLVEFSDSLDRVVEQAHTSIRDDKVNVFDQARINSFIQRRREFDRPLMIKLRDSTYRSYKQVFKRLICFAYRTMQPENRIELAHRLTARQLGHLDKIITIGEELEGLKQSQQTRDGDKQGPNAAQQSLESQLDRACLCFCIAILDHTLKGDLFESTVIGFLAALGVDPEKQNLRDASSFTSYLSAFVKISQMLVIQMSVLMAEEGQIEHPSDVLDEMRERFMIHGSRSPFNWVLRLRAYGKKIRNSSTSLGYIYWSNDHERLTYKQLELSIADFKKFVATQVELAQSGLEQLFLIHSDEEREDVIPTFELRDLKDDPTESAKGWSFCNDPRNKHVLPEGKRWMLDRVLEADVLRAEFIELRKNDSKVLWKVTAAKKYISKIESFLERLLLLVHITAGQPARGTEILSLRHCNTVNGHHRSIFIKNGLVSTVTSYHKGYNIVGSTKIIHRYLPKEVSKLVVYYLWFILPFWRSLDLLVLGDKASRSPFLWSKGDVAWISTRLSNALKEEARIYLQTHLNITYYRHVAIAMSRVYLKSGGFKRDYGIEEKTSNDQASHTTWIAGSIYARGLEEAPGAIEARRAEYRMVSREWHNFLGFRAYMPCTKRPALFDMSDGEGKAVGSRKKQNMHRGVF